MPFNIVAIQWKKSHYMIMLYSRLYIIYSSKKVLHHLYYIHIVPKICKMLGELLSFIDLTFK